MFLFTVQTSPSLKLPFTSRLALVEGVDVAIPTLTLLLPKISALFCDVVAPLPIAVELVPAAEAPLPTAKACEFEATELFPIAAAWKPEAEELTPIASVLLPVVAAELEPMAIPWYPDTTACLPMAMDWAVDALEPFPAATASWLFAVE